MTRGLSAAEVTATQASHRAAAPLVELNFRSGTLRLTLAPWDLTLSGETWLSAGLLQIREVRESAGSIEGLQFSLSGVDPAIQALATPTEYRGRIVRLLKGHFNTTTNAIIGTPKAWFAGRMRHINIEETNSLCRVDLIAEHYEADLGRAVPIFLNDAHQQAIYPGDLGAQHVERMATLRLTWPEKQALIAAEKKKT